ncbi:hypothetical protein M413DRAFT_445934 [Hebeloma cylindrosporum]|uniref:DUF202 domain-containing protein n=1 Tax=Hebeloma cylindrosporum TaxID=76867 RepID=A0A0C2XRZ0_HEBCY|nr:hypothetical protein M413DRAFT_445934 [Hebeloma cylindrosporum h7]
MSELLPKSERDLYSTWLSADESVDRHNSRTACSPPLPVASSSNSRPHSPISHPQTPAAPTLESLADVLTLEHTTLQHHPCPTPLSSASLQKCPRTKATFLDRLKRFSPSMTLENRGSVARDHLASERTFLAYLRTSLALASTGVALVQLFSIADLNFGQNVAQLSATTLRIQRFAKPLGMTAVILALIILFIGLYRYFLIQNALTDNRFPAARASVAFVTFSLSALVVVIFGALLGARSSP